MDTYRYRMLADALTNELPEAMDLLRFSIGVRRKGDVPSLLSKQLFR